MRVGGSERGKKGRECKSRPRTEEELQLFVMLLSHTMVTAARRGLTCSRRLSDPPRRLLQLAAFVYRRCVCGVCVRQRAWSTLRANVGLNTWEAVMLTVWPNGYESCDSINSPP